MAAPALSNDARNTASRLRRLPSIDASARTSGTDPVESAPVGETAGEIPTEVSTDKESTAGKGASTGEAGESTVELDDSQTEQPGTWWPDWTYPSGWILPPVWESSFEIGLDGSEGNSETLSLRTGASLKRNVEWSELAIDVTYVKATADATETKHNAQLDIRHDWIFGESPWSLFGKSQLEYDEFKAYDIRLTVNAGLGYQLINNDSTQLKGRFGSGVSHEFRGPDDRWVPEAVFGMDYEHAVSNRQQLYATMDYLPEWDNLHDYRLHTDFGCEFLLDETANMNLKLGVVDRYDSTPNGRKPNDVDFSLVLLWKL